MVPWMLSGFAKRPGTARRQTDAQLGLGHVVLSVEGRLDSLELACAGMWKLLKDKHGYTEDEIVAAIHAVDAADGSVDHQKEAEKINECPHCHRKLLSRESPLCNWCGFEIERPLI